MRLVNSCQVSLGNGEISPHIMELVDTLATRAGPRERAVAVYSLLMLWTNMNRGAGLSGGSDQVERALWLLVGVKAQNHDGLRDRTTRSARIGRMLCEIEHLAADPDASLRILALRLRKSPSHISHSLKSHTGDSFKTLLMRARLDMARQLMRPDRCLSIKEVAAAAGFRSVSSFDRAFRKQFGCTPSTHRDVLLVERARLIRK